MKFAPGPGTILNRGDLLDAIGSGQHELAVLVAEQLGLTYEPLRESRTTESANVIFPLPSDKQVGVVDSTNYPSKIANISLWLPTQYERRGPLPNVEVKEADCYYKWTSPPTDVVAYSTLIPRNVLNSRMHSLLSGLQTSGKVDIAKLIRQLARCELVGRLPMRRKRSWCQQLCVVRDIGKHLVCFEHDQLFACEQLKRQLPEQDLQLLKGQYPWRLRPDVDESEAQDGRWEQPRPGSQVLVLGDLGAFRSRQAVENWWKWGQQLLEQHCQPIAIVPCCVSRIPKALLNIFHVESMQAIRSADVKGVERQKLVEELLVLCAPAIRVEPGLLRAIRELLPGANDATLEIDFLQHEYLSSNHGVAATIDCKVANEILRPAFERLPRELRRLVLKRMRYWRTEIAYAPEIWFEEILSLAQDSKQLVPQKDLRDARAMVQHFRNVRNEDVEAYQVRSTGGRLSPAAYTDEVVGSHLRKARLRLHGTKSAPDGTDAREGQSGEEQTYWCHVTGKEIEFSSTPTSAATTIRSSTRCVEIWTTSFWKHGKPEWVSDYGRDRHGLWCEFQVAKLDGSGVVTQRMRWVPPGSFTMGSSDEPERDNDEVPHSVTLSEGYWLADTACTQEVWEAVMGENPSHFTGDALRPVEQVSHDDVRQFFERVQELVPGLKLDFPTEAQWEYACRAGTTTPFSFGNQISTEQANYNGDFPYNNGPKGENRTATVGCKEFEPNRWGLYQMHGNVFEWCRDWYAEYLAEEQIDPAGPETGSGRVFRGGSWFYFAGRLRSAYRNSYDPGDRSYLLGFRCMSSPSLAEPNEGAEVPVAEQGSERARAGAASRFFYGRTISLSPEKSTRVDFGEQTRICLKSDLEELTLKRYGKPNWAVAHGNDQYGTYADFEVKNVKQRMRWVPAGRFIMGSPRDEPGRSSDETQHFISITNGYWMFDTPCTQALWLAVMNGENPSHFPDPQRPVEQVDWKQAKEFSQRLTELAPQLTFDLPTEAQWEYACRAGTTTALYSGPLEILGDANAPALDPIAWYGGNSGHEYDLEAKVDLSGYDWLPDKQYDFQFGGTRQVKHKRPNPWGLYDMLGNVWEWCRDWYAEYPDGEQVDPVGPKTGSYRVVRGGAWVNYARRLRSGSRHIYAPGDRLHFLGFRCMSSPSPVAEQVSASRAE
ncbi:MAG: formylglycine-generating enzyme family protein [Planctomycetaceae bacterium]